MCDVQYGDQDQKFEHRPCGEDTTMRKGRVGCCRGAQGSEGPCDEKHKAYNEGCDVFEDDREVLQGPGPAMQWCGHHGQHRLVSLQTGV